MRDALFDFDPDAQMNATCHSDNVGPPVIFLASEAEAVYNGQLWICGGGTLAHMPPATTDQQIGDLR